MNLARPGSPIRRTRAAPSGFSLVELLAVIGIVGLLIAITFPVVSQVRGRARQADCLSRLAQITKASLLYGQDNDGFLPPYVNQWTLPPSDQRPFGMGHAAPDLLRAALMPYVKDRTVWFCPSDPYAGRNETVWNVTHLYSSYFYAFMQWPYLTVNGLNMSSVISDPSPERAQSWTPSGYTLVCDPNGSPEPTGIGCPSDGGNHFQGINRAYLDGHAKWENRCR